MLTDYRINYFSHNSVWICQCGIGELEEQILLATYAFEILKQLALNFPFRTCADVVNGFNQEVD